MPHFRLIVAIALVLSIFWPNQRTSPLAQPLTPLESISQEVNLLAPDQGGQAIIVPSDGWLKPVSGNGDQGAGVNVGEEAVYAFKDEKPATFSKFALLITGANGYNLKEFELLVADDSPTGEFRSLGKFTTFNALMVKMPYQEFAFPPTTARYLKIRALSGWGGFGSVTLPPFRLIGHEPG
jgi:hypothetical protein